MKMHLCITRWAIICVCVVGALIATVAQFQGNKIQPWIAALLFASLFWVWVLVGNKE